MEFSVNDGIYKRHRATPLSVPMCNVDVRICTPIDPQFRAYKEWISKRRSVAGCGLYPGTSLALADMIFIQSLCFCIISSKAWFWCLFGQVQMTPWNCIPSDLDAGNILSCHVLFISFMSSILFVVPIQLFFTEEFANIYSSFSFSFASLFSRLLPGSQYFTMAFTYSVFLHLPLLGFHFLRPVRQRLSILTATWFVRSMLLKRNMKK